MKVCKVFWQDHYSTAGWHDLDNIEEDIFINTSVGFLVKETRHHITLAQTLVHDNEQCGDIITIVKKNIIKREEFD